MEPIPIICFKTRAVPFEVFLFKIIKGNLNFSPYLAR